MWTAGGLTHGGTRKGICVSGPGSSLSPSHFVAVISSLWSGLLLCFVAAIFRVILASLRIPYSFSLSGDP